MMGLANKTVIGLGSLVPSSRWKVWLYRRLGFQIGKHTRIRRGSYIYAKRATLGDGVTLEPGVKIVCQELVMGDEAKIDSETVVYGEGRLEMGRGAYVGPRAWINCATTISLGVNTGVGPLSSIYTHGVWLPYVDGYPRKFEPVILEEGVWVPGNVAILPGVRIGKGSMIGGGSVVTKDVPPNSFAAGSPARVVSSMDTIKLELGAPEVATRLREAVDRFLESLQQKGIEMERETGGFYARGGGRSLRKRPFAIRVFESPLDRETAAGLAVRRDSTEMILIAIAGIADEAIPLLSAARNLHWFDISGKRCSSAWKGYSYELRRYFGSHYGIRFLLVK